MINLWRGSSTSISINGCISCSGETRCLLVLGLVLYIFIPNRTTYIDKKQDIIRVHSATVRGPVGVWYIILLSVLTIVAPWGENTGQYI